MHAGDIGSAAVLESLDSDQGKVFAVVGNNDVDWKWEVADAGVLKKLPEVQEIVLPSGTISIEHGHKVRNTKRYHDELRKRYPQSRIVIYGHTHNRVVDLNENPWVVNPGAAGRNRTRGGPSCLVLDVQEEDWQVSEFCFEPLGV